MHIIKTKRYGFRGPRHPSDPHFNAWWLRQKLGVPWVVTSVLCADEDRPRSNAIESDLARVFLQTVRQVGRS